MSTAPRILVAEDEAIIALGVKDTLSRLGYAVLPVAATGEDAVRLTSELGPDVVLMDIRLKGEMDGIEAAWTIAHLSQTPTVFLTAYSDPETLSRAKNVNPAGYILKPFTPEQLRAAVEIALDRDGYGGPDRKDGSPYATALNSLDLGVIVVRGGGEVLLLNRVAEELTGWSSSAARGQPLPQVMRLLDVFDRHDVVVAPALPLNHVASPGGVRRAVLVGSDNRERLVDYVATLLWAAEPGGAVIAFRDVTELAKLEESERRKEKLDAVGHLAGGVAHEFNNLLMVINGNAQLALEGLRRGEGAAECMQSVLRAGKEAATLVSRLLAFGRMRTYRIQCADLHKLAASLEPSLRKALGVDIDLEISRCAETCFVMVDPTQIGQVIMNLALNAREAMPHGGKLFIETSRCVLGAGERGRPPDVVEGAYGLVRMRDTGCGVDAKMRSMMFEPFFTTKEVGKGPGLGLASAYGIVRQSGGFIDFDSEQGKGTTFRIYLPSTECPAKADRDRCP